MSFVSEIGEAVNKLWPAAQDHYEIIDDVTISIAPCKDITIHIRFENETTASAFIPWSANVDELIEKLKKSITTVAAYEGDKADKILDSAAKRAEGHVKSRKQLKALCPTPLEELAMQAE